MIPDGLLPLRRCGHVCRQTRAGDDHAVYSSDQDRHSAARLAFIGELRWRLRITG